MCLNFRKLKRWLKTWFPRSSSAHCPKSFVNKYRRDVFLSRRPHWGTACRKISDFKNTLFSPSSKRLVQEEKSSGWFCWGLLNLWISYRLLCLDSTRPPSLSLTNLAVPLSQVGAFSLSYLGFARCICPHMPRCNLTGTNLLEKGLQAHTAHAWPC